MSTNSSKPDAFNPSLAQLLKQLTIDAREGRITQEEKIVIKEELLGRRRDFDNADTASDGSSGSDDDELNNFTPEVIEISLNQKKQSDEILVHLLRQLNDHAKRGLIGQSTKLAIKELLLSRRDSDIDKAQKMISLALSGSAPKEDPGADLKFDYRKAKQKQLEEMALISRALKHNFQLLSTGPGVADRYSDPDTKTDLTFRVTLNIIFDGIAVDIIFSMPPKYPQGARPSFYIDASFGLSRGDLIALSTLLNNEINKAGDSRDLLVHSLVTMAQSFVLEYVQFSSDLTQPASLSPPSSSTTSSFSSYSRPTKLTSVDSSNNGPWTGLSRVQIPEPEDIMKIFPAVRGYHMERISSEYLEWRFARKRATLPEEVSRPALAFGEVISTHSIWGNNDRRNSNASNSSVDSKSSKGSSSSSKSQRAPRPIISEQPDPISIKTSKTTSSQDPTKRTRRKSDGGATGGNSARRPLEVETERSNKPAIIHSWSMSLGHTYAPETALYGRGIYLSPNPSLCISHTRGGSICVCLVLRGRVYKCPTIQLGGWLQNKYHSHHSPDGQDIILFDSDQILPCYLIHLKPHHTGRPSPLPSPDLSPRSSRSRSGSGSSGGSTPRSRGGGSRPGSRSSTPGSRNRPGTPSSRNSQPGSRPETPSSQTRSASAERERATTTTSNTSTNSNLSASQGSPSTSRRSQDLTIMHHTPRSKHYVVSSQNSTSPKGTQQPKFSLLATPSTTRIRTSSSVSGKGGSSKKRTSGATKKLRDVLRPKRKSHSPQRTSPMKSSQSSGNIVLTHFQQPPLSSIPTVKLLPSGNLSPPSLIQSSQLQQETLSPPSSKFSQLARSLP